MYTFFRIVAYDKINDILVFHHAIEVFLIRERLVDALIFYLGCQNINAHRTIEISLRYSGNCYKTTCKKEATNLDLVEPSNLA